MFYAVEHGDFVVFCCRTPHGVRGLKWLIKGATLPLITSHPARGAWIEMPVKDFGESFQMSHPARGAWIEIGKVAISTTEQKVAPRTGCVD